MNVRLLLIVLNVVWITALAAYVIWAVISPKRARAEGEHTPANQTEFLPDEDLESRRLERVLGWALLFGGILAVALPLYWLREPARQEESIEYFDEGAAERGKTLFARPGGEGYDSVLSLQCAGCHGDDARGGVKTQIIDIDGPDGPIPPQQYNWKEPALDTVLLRFSDEEVANIIIYGRPGTPMPAFGLAGDGAENDQTISDIIEYLKTIQLTPEEARARADDELALAQEQTDKQLEDAEAALDAAVVARDEEAVKLRTALDLPDADDTELLAACEDIEIALGEGDDSITASARDACKDYVDAAEAVDTAERNVEWAQTWKEGREDVSDGQYLFELFCARCHTEGWSVFEPADPDTRPLLGAPGGGGGVSGGIGFNLRDGAEIRRFGAGEQGDEDLTGFQDHVDFITEGSDANKPYGRLGIGSGRMPGFGDMLTQEQIALIVEYERDGLDDTTYPTEGDAP